MRKLSRGWIWAGLPLLAASAWAIGAGCENTAGDCELTAECTGAPGSTASCDPSKVTGPVADTCGVFVSASAKPGGDGTQAKPFATFASAVDAAKKSGARRVYACSETFAEAVSLPAEFTVYGGLDCAKSWAFSTKGRTTLAPSSGVPITFGAGATTHVENVRATAPDGAAPGSDEANPRSGGPSIAAIALPESDVELVRCELEAGAGADGLAADEDTPLGASPGGKDGDAACATGEGAAAVAHTCADPSAPGGQVDASGGRGGDGEGTPGLLPPAPGAGDAGGAAGVTQTISVTQCSEGGSGDNGADGAAGQGGQSMPTTLLDDAYKGAPGEDGKHGVSGGGGGGGKACSGGPGSGGGSGGGGGCAGAGGKGGGAGGSSIALFAVDATISLDQVSLKAGAAGKGAPGAAGQKGALGGGGGQGGSQVGGEDSVACRGGAGGKGGDGGPGGGGQGGHSIAAVWRTVPPTATKATFTAGTPGVGAAGGTGAGPTGTGANGLACQGLDVDKGQCVAP